MSNLFQQLKEKLGKLRKNNFSYEKKVISPSRDWNIILIFTFVGFIASAILAFYLYLQIDQGKLFIISEKDSQRETKINSVLFQQVVGDINARAASAQELNNNVKIPPDPSL